MTIKALLLGSAAAMAFVSAAQAADAVVIPEPEAVEYVRVCDAAGAGYFYIPGSETCLKIGGYVQFQIATAKNLDTLDYSTESVLEVSSWTDSEFGAVKTYLKIQGGSNDWFAQAASDYAIKMDRATLSIGGLTMGWTNTFFDFADGAGPADDTLFGAGPSEANQITYVGNFSGGSWGVQIVDNEDTTTYAPDFLARVKFNAGNADITLAGVYANSGYNGDSTWGLKAQLLYGGFGAIIQYNDDASKYGFIAPVVIGASYNFDATDKLNLAIGGSYAFHDDKFLASSDDLYVVGLEAKYQLTKTFKVSGRVRALHSGNGASSWDTRLRFKASF